ncbi:hypothetical protein AK830_g459 [Neonectria ditissima]|uniref:Uncharacterized protein n=1 Tax=Neonectria ditissima TaxID=78410 RepID=A0A0N8H908_9HYPO|nr:hypothetical protein AK830_g459 [Neonectria ditissima]
MSMRPLSPSLPNLPLLVPIDSGTSRQHLSPGVGRVSARRMPALRHRIGGRRGPAGSAVAELQLIPAQERRDAEMEGKKSHDGPFHMLKRASILLSKRKKNTGIGHPKTEIETDGSKLEHRHLASKKTPYGIAAAPWDDAALPLICLPSKERIMTSATPHVRVLRKTPRNLAMTCSPAVKPP